MEYIIFSAASALGEPHLDPRLFCRLIGHVGGVEEKVPDSDYGRIYYTRSLQSRCGREWLACQVFYVAWQESNLAWPCSLWPVLPVIRVSKSSCAHSVAAENYQTATSEQWGNLSCHRIRVFIIASKTKRLRCPFIAGIEI
jgi:hypothetical protein